MVDDARTPDVEEDDPTLGTLAQLPAPKGYATQNRARLLLEARYRVAAQEFREPYAPNAALEYLRNRLGAVVSFYAELFGEEEADVWARLEELYGPVGRRG